MMRDAAIREFNMGLFTELIRRAPRASVNHPADHLCLVAGIKATMDVIEGVGFDCDEQAVADAVASVLDLGLKYMDNRRWGTIGGSPHLGLFSKLLSNFF